MSNAAEEPNRQAPERPTRMPARAWRGVLRRTGSEFREDELTDMAAALTYSDVQEGRPAWKTVPLRMTVTVVMVVLLALSSVAVVLTGGLARRVGDLLGVGSTAVTAWDIAKWPVLVLVVSFMFAILYWAAPNV